MRGNVIWFCLLLFHLPVIGNTEIVCTATEEKYITCKFPENLNSTQNDFGVNFYPDDGGEEPLIDCGWIKQKLRCIEQEGFKTMEPVSDTAVFIIPISFVKRFGNYRCVTGKSNSIQPCLFSEYEDEDHFASCETYLPSEGNQVILACNFSAEVERFKIHQNETVVASFKKSDCQRSTSCNYALVDNHSIFTVKLDVSNHSSNEYSCRPDNSSHQFKVKKCTSTQGIHTEASHTLVIEILVAVVGGVFLLTSLIFLLLFLRQKCKNNSENVSKKKHSRQKRRKTLRKKKKKCDLIESAPDLPHTRLTS